MEIISLNSDATENLLAPTKPIKKPIKENKITDLKSGVHNQNRVNIFIDDEFAFSLDLTQVVDYHLKIGKILKPAEIEELKHASAYGKLYSRTFEWVLMRPRSIKETRDHLRLKRFQKRLDYSDADIETVIAKLTKKGYLDDRKFATWFIENRFAKKGISELRLRQELIKKGIDKNLIDELLENSPRDEAEEIKKVIQKRGAKTEPQKLLGYLVRHGFSLDLSRELVEEYYNSN
ncbi:RecX family transcriptional regulator [Candidatus Saccharibacteria bacterium]|nr:RecX family transcriptional regulator [Candidatus Saccharibacteria bacterium]